MLCPEYVNRTIAKIESAGFEAYIVGGALRDLLLGIPSHDFDVTTSAMPEDIMRIFADEKTIPTGIKHGTVTVICDGNPIEITTFRVDGDYTDSRHPSSVSFATDIADDLSRRDFTVNAMAYSERTGIVDLFGGRDDLEKKLVRAVGEPEKRFCEDALRILRAFRFCSKLGFDIETETLKAAEKCRMGLKNISAERITSELSGILVGDNAAYSLELMDKAQILSKFFKSVEKSDLERISLLPRSFEARATYLLKSSSENEVAEFTRIRKLSNKSAFAIKKLHHFLGLELEDAKPECLKRIIADVDDLLADLVALGVACGKDMTRLADVARNCAENGDCLRISELAISGEDLKNMGLGGAEIGKTLNRLLDAALTDPSVNTRNRLLALACELSKRD